MWAVATVMLIALATSADADETGAFKGALCFVAEKHAPNCRSVEANSIQVAGADVQRAFVWSSADAKRLVFGVLPPKGESVDLLDKALRDVTLRIRGDRLHGWPEDVQIHVRDANKKEWKWRVPAKSADSLAELRLPAGKYTIVFSADHHLKEERQIDLSKNTALREVLLRPMPVIAGRVLTMKDQPIANAELTRSDGTRIASSDEQGNFRGEVGEPLPDTVLVQKSGFGSRLLPLRLAEGDANLGTIRLGTGIKLSLHIQKPEGSHEVLSVGLQRRTESNYTYTQVALKELAADNEELVFEDLSGGDYSVIIRGKNPLETLTTDVKLDASDVQREIKIEPYRLDGTAHIGEDPIDGDLGISMSRFSLNLKLPIQNGQFSATLWQHGKLTGVVKARELGTYEVTTSPELGADPSTWDIRFPKRLISGRVYDAGTQRPVEGAKMELLRSSGDSRWYGVIHIQEDGAYSILAVKTGTYELSVTAPEYADMKQTVEVRDDDNGSLLRDFALKRGQVATLEVVWPSGTPVANATVLDGIASDGYQAERHYTLDASGRLSLRLQRDELRTLFIVPREGSFVVAHLAAKDDSDANPTRVIVPVPAGSMHIEISTVDGKPAASAGVGMRFDGETIPAPVLYEIGFRVSPQTLSDRLLLQLPAGAYELWPVSVLPWTASSQSRAAIGEVKRVALSAGAMNVDLVAQK
jgi:hypothetical protein